MMLNAVDHQQNVDMSDDGVDLNDNNDEEDGGNQSLEKMKQTLSMRHLCPTAPDTLRVFPFKDSDPFVIAQENSDLMLDSQITSQKVGQTAGEATSGDSNKCTSFPHVYFAGNMLAYKSELIKRTKNAKDGFVKVISVPQFVKSHSIVLLDLQTMETQEMKFDISQELFG